MFLWKVKYDAINSCRHHKHHHRRHRQHHRGGGGGGHHHHKKHHKRRHQQQQRHHRDYDYYEEEAEDDNNSVLTGLTQEQRQEVLGVLENNFLSSFGLKPPSKRRNRKPRPEVPEFLKEMYKNQTGLEVKDQ